ncbi:thymidylate synthase [Schlegelella sp. S2-27]|uniref:Thymidylate synthase n=1 Tax=Caldimonas mangrovi TaxID=2944811 RepID=A0ABT0YKU3_9BURK|nr:thymidylate synthase [Caldimonas mangrovi]
MTPLFITSDNLSAAWSRVYLHILDHPGKEISPLIVSITGFDKDGRPQEDASVRAALDAVLTGMEAVSVDDAAFTIFPQRLWLMARGDRKRLFQMYCDWAFPSYQKSNRKLNGRGLYFERLVKFGSGPESGNQLEWILSQYEKSPAIRRSMLQASVFDPARDHVAQAQVVFPCLQHVSFLPTKNGLAMNAFYATQQLLYRAYGNFLGLAQLGAFMAHEMGMPLVQLNLTAGVEKLDGMPKTSRKLDLLTAAARACVSAEDAAEQAARPGTAREGKAVAAA